MFLILLNIILVVVVDIVKAEPVRVTNDSECAQCLSDGTDSSLCRSQDPLTQTAYCCAQSDVGVKS